MTKEVLYNGQCPICSAEIAHYQAAAAACGADLRFVDLNQTDLESWGLDAESAARRLHIRDASGKQIAGVPAFTAIWQELPRWRWFARILMLPGIRQATSWAYDYLAAPALFALHKRRQRKR